MLRDYVRDQRFMIAAVNNGGWEIGRLRMDITPNNIPFDKILNSFKTFSASDHVYNAANALLLELIAAFDSAEGRRKERLLNTATEIADWLCDLPETAWDARISRLNKLQLIKRVRELNDDERNTLYDITEGWPRQKSKKNRTIKALQRGGPFLILRL